MSAPQTMEGPEKLRLKVVAGNAAGVVIEVEEEFMIGRHAAGDGTLANDIEISREHARIVSEANGCFAIEDLGSTNGTFVNGRRLEGSTILETGDRIEVGASALVVQVSAPQPTPISSDTIAPPQPASEPDEAGSSPAAMPPAFTLKIEVVPGAGTAKVVLDESSDEVNLVYEDGRWRLG